MAKFFYKSKQNGEIKEGFIVAYNVQEASKKIEASGMIVLELKEENQTNLNTRLNYELKPLTIKEKRDFYSSFYKQYKAGISFLEIFNNLITTTSTNNVKTLCFNIVRKLQKENSIENVFSFYSEYLGKTYATLIAAGEKSGKLENVLEKISQQVQKEEEFKTTIISKTTYPAAILGLLVFSICVFVFYVFPVFNLLSQGETVDHISLCINAIIKILICSAVIAILILGIIKNKNIQNKFINWFLNSTPARKILEEYNLFNFFTVLHLAQEAGIPQVEAMDISNKMINLSEVNKKISKAHDMISQGCEINTAFSVAGVFSDFALSQISSGEKTGELSKAYKEIANDYKQSCMLKINTLLKLLEPSMLLIACIFITIFGIKVYSKYYKALFSMF